MAYPAQPYPAQAPRWPLGNITPVFNSTQDSIDGTAPIYTDGGAGYTDADGRYANWWVGGWEGPKQEWDETKLRERVRLLPHRSIYVLDIEHWPSDLRHKTDAQVEETIRKLRHMLALIRDERSDLLLGCYGLAPCSAEYWPPVNLEIGLEAHSKLLSGSEMTDYDQWALSTTHSKRDGRYALDEAKEVVKQYRAWQRTNDRMAWGKNSKGAKTQGYGLVDAVDVICPSLYVAFPGDDATRLKCDRWMIRHNMQEAMRYGKPVLPYMMPAVHHASAPEGQRDISPTRWANILDTIYTSGAAGLILWWHPQMTEQQLLLCRSAVNRFGSWRGGTR